MENNRADFRTIDTGSFAAKRSAVRTDAVLPVALELKINPSRPFSGPEAARFIAPHSTPVGKVSSVPKCKCTAFGSVSTEYPASRRAKYAP